MPFDSTLNEPNREPTQNEVFAARLEKLADIAEKDTNHFNMHSWATCLASIACRSHEFPEFRACYSGAPVYNGQQGGAACQSYFGDRQLFAPVDKPYGTKESDRKPFYIERLRVRAQEFRDGASPVRTKLRELVFG